MRGQCLGLAIVSWQDLYFSLPILGRKIKKVGNHLLGKEPSKNFISLVGNELVATGDSHRRL